MIPARVASCNNHEQNSVGSTVAVSGVNGGRQLYSPDNEQKFVVKKKMCESYIEMILHDLKNWTETHIKTTG